MTFSTTKTHHKNVAHTFKETIESLIVAFILAFVFRAFVVEAFVIPTGSMADTLRGAHFNLNCQKCGYQFNYGFVPERYPMTDKNGNPYIRQDRTPVTFGKGTIPPYPVSVNPALHRRKNSNGNDMLRDINTPNCPTCGTSFDSNQKIWVSNGDRILVLKYIYQFKDPDTWDVVVFKNPTDPQENYIKRLIGRPGETIEVVDGDVYIDHKITQKPEHVQKNLWLVAFDNNFQPTDNHQQYWQQPFEPSASSSKWNTSQPNHAFSFLGSKKPDTISYNPKRLKYACSNYCYYNGPSTLNEAVVSDLKIEFELAAQGNSGSLELSLGKYGRVYTAMINFDGTCTLTNTHNNSTLKLTDADSSHEQAQGKFQPFKKDQHIKIAFTNLDHRFEIMIGKKKFYHTGHNNPADWGYQKPGFSTYTPPSVSLTATGQPFSLANIKLYRDTHYTNGTQSSSQSSQGTEGKPFKLDKDQFFVMGDNSPQSHDSRFWNKPGLGNAKKEFRQGTVPREYLIGKAFFVYWPGGFRPHKSVPYAIIPDVGNMRFIH